MKNNLVDLNNHLFAEIERLGDEDLKGDDLDNEIKRSKAIAEVSQKIIENADLGLKAEKFKVEYQGAKVQLPEMLEEKRTNGKA